MNITLTTEQEDAVKHINKFLESGDDQFFLLLGSAGTGKTSIIIKCINDIKNKKIVFSATTNKAVSVLENMMNNKIRNDVNFITIHKLLKIKRKIDNTGRESFISTIESEEELLELNTNSIYNYDIIVIDEVSMLSMDLIEKIIKLKNKITGKIIFVGDNAQLPPINEDNSYIFSLKIKRYELKHIMRYDGNLLLLSNQIRDLVINNKNINLKKTLGKQVKLYKDKDKWLNEYINEIYKNNLKINDELPIILAYTNKECDLINQKVRNIIFKNPKHKYITNDIIVFNNYYNLRSNKKVYYTSEQTQINSVVIDKIYITELSLSKLLNTNINTNINIKIKNVLNLSEYIIIENIDKHKCSICQIICKKLYKKICEHLYCKKCINNWFSITYVCAFCIIDNTNNKIKFKNDDKLNELIDELYICNKNKSYNIWLIINNLGDSIITINETDIELYKNDIENIKKNLLNIKNYIETNYKNDVIFMNLFIMKLWCFYYYEYIDQFADIIYGYSLTTHKSQGSTYKNVYVNMHDIIFNNRHKKNSYQCLYTAITRCSNYIQIFY